MELKYSYKRGSSRSNLCINNNLVYWQSIFASRALRNFSSGKTLINIDESSFTRSVKLDYSWLPIGESHPIVNTWGTGRAVVLFALISNGDWIWFVSKRKTDSENFWNFIILLAKYIELWMDFTASDSELILDNASIHLSATTKLITRRLGLRMWFLPQYSPNLAPVEIVFGMLKCKLRSKRIKQVIKFSLISGRREICNALTGFTKAKVCRLWSVFIQEAKKVILQSRENEIVSFEEHIEDQ